MLETASILLRLVGLPLLFYGLYRVWKAAPSDRQTEPSRRRPYAWPKTGQTADEPTSSRRPPVRQAAPSIWVLILVAAGLCITGSVLQLLAP